MRNKEKGQAMVEFALLLLPIVFLFLGIAASAFGFWYKVSLESAVREGGRAAAIWRPDGAGATSCLHSVLEAVDQATFLTPDVTVSDNCTNNPWARIPSGETITVEAKYNYQVLFYSTLPMVGPLFSVDLKAQVTQMHE